MFTGVNIRSLGPEQAVYRGKHDLVLQYDRERNSGHAPPDARYDYKCKGIVC